MDILIALLAFVVVILLIVRLKRRTDKNKVYHKSTPRPYNYVNPTKIHSTNIVEEYSTAEIFESAIKNLKNERPSQQINTDDIVGFCGEKKYSENRKFCVAFTDGYLDGNNWEKGDIAVLFENKIQFEKKIARPSDCHISNNGITVCCDLLDTDELSSNFIIFDKMGNLIFSKQTTAILGLCSISFDGKIAAYETHVSKTEDSDSIFIVNVEDCTLISKFRRPKFFTEIRIDSSNMILHLVEHRNLEFKVDFNGKHVNPVEYELQTLEKGSTIDKLNYYLQLPADERYATVDYIKILEKAIKSKQCKEHFGEDKLFKLSGEYYEYHGDIHMTIDYWEKALNINPKVGVKRKLEKLKDSK